jgi:hypothetical protein
MIVDSQDLEVAYKAYSEKKIMRKDLFRIIIDNMQADRAKLKALIDREQERRDLMASLTTDVADMRRRLDSLDDQIDTKVATAANSALTIWSRMTNGEDNAAPRRGRPPKSAEAGA